MNGIEAHHFADLLSNDVPLIDLRAPSEFARGALPGAVNMPLLSDDERTQVGTRYKEQGQQAAIALGHALVANELRQLRIESWRDYALQHANAVLYCWRGGLRSQIVQGWLADQGVELPRVSGGYKALRNYLLSIIDAAAQRPQLIVAGQTGSGKTDLLLEFPNSIDLEHLANHRGSAFGRRLTQQPSQINFENALGISLLKHQRASPDLPHVLEDESRTIGRVAIPETYWTAMRSAPVVLLQVPRSERVIRIRAEYVDAALLDLTHQGTREPVQHLYAHLRRALDAIRKRLGGLRHQRIAAELEHAFSGDQTDHARHHVWIESLLSDYYDPMYEYQLSQKQARVVMRGDRNEVLQYLTDAMRR